MATSILSVQNKITYYEKKRNKFLFFVISGVLLSLLLLLLTKIFPEFEGKVGGGGIRVPVPDGSLTDITCYVTRDVSVEEINRSFKTASETTLKGILEYTEDPIVSVDVLGNTHSCLFDAQLTTVLGRMVKVVGWYDNEIGYSSRIIDLILHLSKSNKN